MFCFLWLIFALVWICYVCMVWFCTWQEVTVNCSGSTIPSSVLKFCCVSIDANMMWLIQLWSCFFVVVFKFVHLFYGLIWFLTCDGFCPDSGTVIYCVWSSLPPPTPLPPHLAKSHWLITKHEILLELNMLVVMLLKQNNNSVWTWVAFHCEIVRSKRE